MARLLVVDDTDELRSGLARALQGAGFLVDTAVDGADGLEAATREPYDAVITDITMPRMDGIELITKLRATERYKTTPILVVSALGQAEMVRRGREAGANAWMLKPFKVEHVVAAVRGAVTTT